MGIRIEGNKHKSNSIIEQLDQVIDFIKEYPDSSLIFAVKENKELKVDDEAHAVTGFCGTKRDALIMMLSLLDGAITEMFDGDLNDVMEFCETLQEYVFTKMDKAQRRKMVENHIKSIHKTIQDMEDLQ